MNLALKDIRHNLSRFSLTALGIGMLLMIVMGMGGIYQGLIKEATLLVDDIGADLWVVQYGTRGPFAEISRIPRNLEDRLQSVPGVLSARAFVTYAVQREYRSKPLRMQVQGLSWPEDKGEWLPLVAGRRLGAAHYEVIADQILGLQLGDELPLGKNVYKVVGITKGMSSMSGDGLAFFSLLDSLDIQYDYSGEAIRLEREARRWRVARQDIGHTQPSLLERAELPSANLAALPLPSVSAVLVRLIPGTDPDSVVAKLSGWTDVSVFTREQQKELLLRGVVDRARRQLGLFRALLIVISAIIMALILYTLTLEKIHDIAMLKLIGARNSVILALILQQALLLGLLGYIFAFIAGKWVFPMFPRRVVINTDDLVSLAVIVFVISVLSAGLGVWKALRVEPNEVVS
ncbi:MAG: ABC transporter permease [Deltaproteobacteria bacterium]|nr:ABC transporter permease [Deltaproteobacteria bacterium]